MAEMKNYQCNDCEFTCDKDQELISHYAKEHRDRAEGCYDATGKTWDRHLTAILKQYWDARTELNKLRTEHQQLAEKHLKLVQRWNAIVLIVGN